MDPSIYHIAFFIIIFHHITLSSSKHAQLIYPDSGIFVSLCIIYLYVQSRKTKIGINMVKHSPDMMNNILWYTNILWLCPNRKKYFTKNDFVYIQRQLFIIFLTIKFSTFFSHIYFLYSQDPSANLINTKKWKLHCNIMKKNEKMKKNRIIHQC